MGRFNRLDVGRSLDSLILSESGLAFQRLARLLLATSRRGLIAHAEHNDLGRDATIPGPDGDTAVAISLTASLAKIVSDVERQVATWDSVKAVLFITPRSVSNNKVRAWAHALQTRYAIRLRVLERAWVIDQCLRPENAFAVHDILGLRPSEDGPRPSLEFGPISLLARDRIGISRIEAAISPSSAFAVWSRAPDEKASEQVFLTRLRGGSGLTVAVGPGADGDCAVIGEDVYVSWINRDHTLGTWSVAVTKFSADLSSSTTQVVSADVQLVGWPSLRISDGRVLVTYLERLGGGTGLTTVDANSGSRQSHALSFSDAVGMEVTRSHAAIVASIETRRGIELMSLVRGVGGWRHIAHLNRESTMGLNTNRYAIDSDGAQVMLLYEPIDREWDLWSIQVDLQTGEIGEPWAICHAGKFPALRQNGGLWLGTWVGSPPLPLELQGTNEHYGASSEMHERARDDVLELARKLERDRAAAVGQAWREPLNEVLLVHPWAPLWVGAISTRGECTRAEGPLGYGALKNVCPALAFDSQRGLLVWRSDYDEDDERGYLMCREFAVV